jgi:hypothetical protein
MKQLASLGYEWISDDSRRFDEPLPISYWIRYSREEDCWILFKNEPVGRSPFLTVLGTAPTREAAIGFLKLLREDR